MPAILKTIKLLRRVLKDENCRRMNRSTVIGFLGELLIKEKLEYEGCGNLEFLGNQSGYDLRNGNIKIDVKCSTLKNEIKKGFGKYWGWALVTESKKRHISCTHFICVALDDDYQVAAYYVISSKDVTGFHSGVGQFGGVKHGFVVGNKINLKVFPTDWRNYFKVSKKLISAGKAIYVSKNGSLLRVLNKI